MKAKDVAVRTKVTSKITVHDHYGKTVRVGDIGIILANDCRQGDEVCVVEWESNFAIDAFNINDLNVDK